MKRILFVVILAMSSICCNGQCLKLDYIKNWTALPFKSCENDLSQESIGLPREFSLKFETFAWTDLALTQTLDIVRDKNEYWPVSNIDRKYSINKDFTLTYARIGAYDFERGLLITTTVNDDYIDSISVDAALAFAGTDDFYLPMKWEITEDLQVVVYQLKPTSESPIMSNTPIADSIEAQRIDRIYQLGDDGKFTHLETKYYKPQMYSKSNFLDPAYDISVGGEALQVAN